MMRHTQPKIHTQLMVDRELVAANTKHPPFASEMEALGVIEEERREVEECMEEFNESYKEFRHWLRNGRNCVTLESARRMRESMEFMIEESLQLAAMGQKYIDMGSYE